jgi:integrase
MAFIQKSFLGMNEREPPATFTEEQVNLMLEKARCERDKLLIYLLAKVGLRSSTILELKVKDIDYGRGYIFWTLLKPRRRKWLPVSDNVLIQLKRYTKLNCLAEEDYIFKSIKKPENHIITQRVRQIVEETAYRCGIMTVGEQKQHPHPHHFRHFFSIKWAKFIKSPAQVKLLADARGDKCVDTVYNSYLQLSRQDLKDLANEIDPPEVSIEELRQQVKEELKKDFEEEITEKVRKEILLSLIGDDDKDKPIQKPPVDEHTLEQEPSVTS